jgi:hypothetical protein
MLDIERSIIKRINTRHDGRLVYSWGCEAQVKTKCFTVSKTSEDDGGRRRIWTKKHDQLVSQKSKSVLTECDAKRMKESKSQARVWRPFNECLWVVQIFTVSKTSEVATAAGKNERFETSEVQKTTDKDECFTVSKTSEVPTAAGKPNALVFQKQAKTTGKDGCFTVSKTSEDDGARV